MKKLLPEMYYSYFKIITLGHGFWENVVENVLYLFIHVAKYTTYSHCGPYNRRLIEAIWLHVDEGLNLVCNIRQMKILSLNIQAFEYTGFCLRVT